MKVTANDTSTSPVTRGVWINERIRGDTQATFHFASGWNPRIRLNLGLRSLNDAIVQSELFLTK